MSDTTMALDTMVNEALAKVDFGVVERIGRERNELTQAEVDALAVSSFEATELAKTVKKATDTLREEAKKVFFNVADHQAGTEKSFTLYSPSTGLKLAREVSKVGGGIDQDVLLMSLYKQFGEEPGDKSGKAWALFKKVSVVPEVPRQLDPGLLEVELAKATSVMNKGGSPELVEAVKKATVPPKVVERFCPKKMTGDELKLAKTGELQTGAAEG